MFWGFGFLGLMRIYYATKSKVEKSKMAASKLQMHVSPLPDMIINKKRSNGYTYVFGVRLSIVTHGNSIHQTESGKIQDGGL